MIDMFTRADWSGVCQIGGKDCFVDIYEDRSEGDFTVADLIYIRDIEYRKFIEVQRVYADHYDKREYKKLVKQAKRRASEDEDIEFEKTDDYFDLVRSLEPGPYHRG